MLIAIFVMHKGVFTFQESLNGPTAQQEKYSQIFKQTLTLQDSNLPTAYSIKYSTIFILQSAFYSTSAKAIAGS